MVLIAPIAATDIDNATLPNGRSRILPEEIPMRFTIPLVVAIFVGPSALAQSPSQDNAGQIPNNSGAGVPGLPGNKSGPARRPNGITQDARIPPVRARIRATFPDCQAQSRGLRCASETLIGRCARDRTVRANGGCRICTALARRCRAGPKHTNFSKSTNENFNLTSEYRYPTLEPATRRVWS